MARKRIIHVCAVDATMDKLLRELSVSSVNQGYEVIGVCSYGNATRKLLKEGFNIINISIDRSIKPVSNLKSIYKMVKLFREIKPHVVHVHTPVAAVLGRISARIAGVPHIIYTAHGFYFHENMAPALYRLTLGIEKFMARHFTDIIFTQSEEDARTAVENNFKPKERILAIGNGVDVWGKFYPGNINGKEINTLRNELGINEDIKVVTFIGRLVKEKGILDLLKAFSELDRDDVKLLVVGDTSQGDRDTKTISLIQEYRKCRNIVFTGIRNDIGNILYVTDIFCLPSYREGMPRTIIEAMAMNCAVVATNIRGSREEVVDGQTGCLVKVADIEDIKDKICMLLNSEGLLDIMKFNGRQRAEALYDEKKVVALQLDVLEKLLCKESC